MDRQVVRAMARLSWIGALAGCASIQPGADRTPLDEPGAPGAVAVVVQAAAPEAAFATPGYPESLAGGALAGGLAGALAGYGLAPLALLGGPATLAAAAAAMSAIFVGGVVIGVVGGTAAGASVVVPADEVAAIYSVVDK